MGDITVFDFFLYLPFPLVMSAFMCFVCYSQIKHKRNEYHGKYFAKALHGHLVGLFLFFAFIEIFWPMVITGDRNWRGLSAVVSFGIMFFIPWMYMRVAKLLRQEFMPYIMLLASASFAAVTSQFLAGIYWTAGISTFWLEKFFMFWSFAMLGFCELLFLARNNWSFLPDDVK